VRVTALTKHGMSSVSFCHTKYLLTLLEFTVFSICLAAIFPWCKSAFPKWYSVEHWASVKENKGSARKLHYSINDNLNITVINFTENNFHFCLTLIHLAIYFGIIVILE
jgi:hypothetical protein